MAAHYNDPKVQEFDPQISQMFLATFMYTLIRLIQINVHKHDNSVYIVNLYTVSIGNPMIMSFFQLFPGFIMELFNSDVITNFVQLLYIIFYHKILWGQRILCPLLSKIWGSFPLTLGPCSLQQLL